MLESVRFEVTSWYHNLPNQSATLIIPEPLLYINTLVSAEKVPIGMKFLWTFTMNHDNGVTALRYQASDDYLVKDKHAKDVTVAEIKATCRISHLKYRKEFDKIKIGFNLDYVIPAYVENDGIYEKFIKLLQ